jgi:hypothetical protein
MDADEMCPIFPLVRLYGKEGVETALNDMRKAGLVRIVAISDYRDATQDELDDSIEGCEEVLFYVKWTGDR